MNLVNKNKHMNELVKELSAVLGTKPKPVQFECTFAVTIAGDVVMLSHSAPEGLLDDGDPSLEDLLGRVPEKSGAYKGVVEVQTFSCNPPQDPTEWDINFTILNFQELIFTELQTRKAILETLKSQPDLARSIDPEDHDIEVFGAKVLALQNKIIDSL